MFPECGKNHQKSNYLLILAIFVSEAVEACCCHFFENWLIKLKCPLLLKPLATIVKENFQSFYPSESFRISHFTMRHPVFPGIRKIQFWLFKTKRFHMGFASIVSSIRKWIFSRGDRSCLTVE